MAGAYAYFENDVAIIGNDYLERCFSTKDNKLSTIKIVNKRIKGEKTVEFNSFSAEFYIALKKKKFFGYETEIISSNQLELNDVSIFNRRVSFLFKPFIYNTVPITFIVNVEIEDDKHYMHKYIEMMVDPNRQHLVTVDYIDCEHICIKEIEQKWTIGDIEEAYLSKYHSALGQPVYINGLFLGSEFPIAENNIENDVAYIRYFSGKRFDELNLNCGHTYRTWKTVIGAARGYDLELIRQDFLSYIKDISRNISPRFQYNSWYDHMHDITNENISKSFKEIEKNLSKTFVPPLDSYVVDDGFVDWKADFWSFNEKFPEELYPASSLARKFSSNFGLWNGPRGGYNNETGKFGKRMEKAGKGGYNRAAKDVCVSSHEYIKNITAYYLDNMRKFDINYWKLDGFLLKACPSKKHGHLTGGYNDMYQYTEMWENWIDIFRKIRIARESIGKDMWINQTSYCNASPWFLQWADSLWIQNSGDIGYIDTAKDGTKLSSNDADRVLTYRDDRHYDFSVTRNYQFPCEYLYNHDPIYGNTAKITMSDDDYRKYMFMMATRGTAFWELYYSYNMFNEAKWRINADALRFVRNEYQILKNARFFGGAPSKGEIYGYSAWNENAGIISIRNPGNVKQSYTLTLDKLMGVSENAKDLKMARIFPYTEKCAEKTFNYGEQLTFELEPTEVQIYKLSMIEEPLPKFIYGRFDSENELLLFFDNRVFFTDDEFTCDNKISQIDLLEDYSTVKITFADKVDSVDMDFTVKNTFGKKTKVYFKCKNHKDFICYDNKIPHGRDFTVSCVVTDSNDGEILTCCDVLSVSCVQGNGYIKFGENANQGDLILFNGDKLTITCEPNGLAKLYVNGELTCSAYNANYCKELENCSVTLTDKATDLKVMSKCLSYDEI